MGAVGDTRARAKGGAFAAGAGEERDRLDPFELVVLALGFGLCHAWVVGFLAFAARYSLNESGLFGYDQVYLFRVFRAHIARVARLAVPCATQGRTLPKT